MDLSKDIDDLKFSSEHLVGIAKSVRSNTKRKSDFNPEPKSLKQESSKESVVVTKEEENQPIEAEQLPSGPSVKEPDPLPPARSAPPQSNTEPPTRSSISPPTPAPASSRRRKARIKASYKRITPAPLVFKGSGLSQKKEIKLVDRGDFIEYEQININAIAYNEVKLMSTVLHINAKDFVESAIEHYKKFIFDLSEAK